MLSCGGSFPVVIWLLCNLAGVGVSLFIDVGLTVIVLCVRNMQGLMNTGSN